MNEDRGPIVPLPAELVRARSRPRAILGMYAWESVLALLAAAPAMALVRAAYGRGPAGDAPLWEGGALPLLAMLTREGNGARAALSAASVVLLLAAVAGLVPLAALLETMAFSTPGGDRIGAARALDRGLLAFRPFLRLLAIVAIGQVLAIGCGVLLGEAAQGWTERLLGEARAQQAAIVVGGAIAALALALAVVHDLGRAAVVRREVPAVHALAIGGGALRRAPLSLGWAWGWRAAASLALLLAGGAAAGLLGGRSGLPLVELWAAHQLVVLGRVALRASWLARALRAVDVREE